MKKTDKNTILLHSIASRFCGLGTPHGSLVLVLSKKSSGGHLAGGNLKLIWQNVVDTRVTRSTPAREVEVMSTWNWIETFRGFPFKIGLTHFYVSLTTNVSNNVGQRQSTFTTTSFTTGTRNTIGVFRRSLFESSCKPNSEQILGWKDDPR